MRDLDEDRDLEVRELKEDVSRKKTMAEVKHLTQKTTRQKVDRHAQKMQTQGKTRTTKRLRETEREN